MKILRALPLLACLGCVDGERGSTPPDPLVAGFLANPGFRWRRIDAPGVRLYVQPGSYAAHHASELAAAAREARAHAYRMLEMPDDGAALTVFLVEDREQMVRLTGDRERGRTYPEERTTALIASEHWRPFLRHELMHAVSIGAWGYAPAGDWVQEGVATDAEGVCGPYDVDQVARFLVHRGRAISLADLTARFREQDDLTAYMLAGSLVRHLRRSHGMRAVHAVWSGGSAELARVTGRTLGDVEREWRREMAAGPAPAIEWETLAKNGCGWRP